MSPEIVKLRDELAKSNNHETSFLRGCIADLVRDKADRNLLNTCLTAGVLQDYFQEANHDIFFIRRCKNKLIEDFFITESGAEKAVGFCKFLAGQFITVSNLKINLDDLRVAEGFFEDHKQDKINDSSDKSGRVDLKNRDELFNDVSRFVVERQMSLTSAIQRKYLIGYNRAGRIIDQLEAAGIVGKNNGSKPRQILIQDVDSLEQILKKIDS